MKRWRLPFTAVLTAISISAESQIRYSSSMAFEQRIFMENPQWSNQLSHSQASVILEGDIKYRSRANGVRAEFAPYIRLDERDSERSYTDIREAYVSKRMRDWEVLIGITRVFWGVNESHNPVDILNQRDSIEDIDGEEKLGQSMIRVSHRALWGNIDAYYLPFFRERAFAGQTGRFRGPSPIDDSNARYQRSADEYAGDVAVRYTARKDKFDIGLHAFQGTARDPIFVQAANGAIVPEYRALKQLGADLQFTDGSWLLKAEAVSTEITQHFLQFVGGFEYTFFDLANRGLDLGLIGEYLFDDRDQNVEPANVFDDDYFLGARLTWNDIQDTELLAGAIVDADSSAIQASIEFQRRLGSEFLIELEGRFFGGSRRSDIASVTQDDVLLARLTMYL